MNVNNSLMGDINSLNLVRAREATQRIFQKVQNQSAATLQVINQQNSVPSYMASKAYVVSISPLAAQRNAAQNS
ncbi:MAG: hypothetical protein HQL95_05860 [Magnetococcales bacterium]|nr:hypothetical protein [Magnetococcales bacterium]